MRPRVYFAVGGGGTGPPSGCGAGMGTRAGWLTGGGGLEFRCPRFSAQNTPPLRFPGGMFRSWGESFQWIPHPFSFAKKQTSLLVFEFNKKFQKKKE